MDFQKTQKTELGRVWDISPVIHSATAVFPGDKSFQREVSLDFKKGHHLVLSSISTTVHVGAHTDAPNHYHAKGESIEKRALDYYLGAAQVVKVSVPKGGRIDLKTWGKREVLAPRVLFHTGTFPNPDQWNGDFAALSKEVIDFLASKKVKLVGIDTPSIDPADDKILESHHAVFEHNLAVLEGIVLSSVPEGVYNLVALPLPIQEADASPVRAVLIERGSHA